MDAVVFNIDEQPVPKQRPRRGRGGHFYTPKRTKDWEQLVHYAYLEQVGTDAAFTDPVAVFLFLRRERGPVADIDNLEKGVLDGLNGAAWDDDAIVEAVFKVVLRNHSNPGVSVVIQPLHADIVDTMCRLSSLPSDMVRKLKGAVE